MSPPARMAPPDVGAMLQAAVRAPSSHNTQPWRFRIVDADSLELRADRTRALPVNDPDGRELVVSCGTALCNLRLAASATGWAAEVTYFPDGADADLVARVRFVSSAAPADPLAAGILRRHTVRSEFADRPLPDGLADRLVAAAGGGEAVLHVVDGAGREELAALVVEGDRHQFADHRWRRELAAWMHPSRRGDGLAVGTLAAPVARTVVSTFDLGARMAARDRRLALSARLLAVLATAGDEPGDWLEGGEALERVLLTAAVAGVQAGFLNQPCQVAHLRPAVRRLLPDGGEHPLVVLRFGIPAGAPPWSPRRAASDLVDPARPS